MPISSFYGLQTTLRGLLAQQRALDTTGHNIANASTPGFTRQEAVLAASPAYVMPAGVVANGAQSSLGSGVDVQDFRRVRDGFLDAQYRGQATGLGNAGARSQALDRAELALAEPSENGIAAQLTQFWNAWSDLANRPNDPAAKQNVLETGSSLADAFHAVAIHLGTVAQQARAEYDALVRPAGAGDAGGEIAQAATEIARLNDTIKRFVSAGDHPNDLLDRRDQLLDQLAALGQLSIEDNADGTMKVSLVDSATGTPHSVVDGTTATWAGDPGVWSPGGRLGALRDLAKPGGTLDGYLQGLDTVAASLASKVNGTIAAAGGTPFFATTPGQDASTLAVVPRTSDDVHADGPTAADGANGVARALANLRDDLDIDRRYRAFVAQVGSEVKQAKRTEANAQVLTDAVEDRRQSLSGVALDEEMSNLVRFQRAYQASARAMSTMDEALDVLINRTGRVGL
jgi:flagellar hook-associated protein 1 FlgK